MLQLPKLMEAIDLMQAKYSEYWDLVLPQIIIGSIFDPNCHLHMWVAVWESEGVLASEITWHMIF
ncbi:hypothetical protein AMAG_20698 [Allomyces macrogynus ATCC 38327]|uniref:hAT-like transposase RNase-H fold domain-containing protein n=1 Tax=Allomyces macrogynus (strain ATCC 38327) TaxID=578462 RepID=A0A0L0TEU2_ALLM3|nr:hypothetical protein AMAG_20698 [Allomyces macrogynus ATCC 38327]|eukprot:KNE73176.1 hypothetical protein AMAG_20698 [Allomyces macrogynus ATCC 38327]